MRELTDPLLSTQQLEELLGRENIRIFDASWYLPAMERDAHQEYTNAHIPGAKFFDLDALSDQDSPLPHMMPSASYFADKMGGMGVSIGDMVVFYDGMGIFSAARAWWMALSFGFENIAVLDGGLQKWQAEGRPLEAGSSTATRVPLSLRRDDRFFKSCHQVAEASAAGDATIIDARPHDRFTGASAEPREGMRSGHIPGSCNLPFPDLLREDGTMKTADELRIAFVNAGVDLRKPVITTCGSGVTAAIINLALVRMGNCDHTLYDGSWTEWGGRDDLPIQTGDA